MFGRVILTCVLLACGVAQAEPPGRAVVVFEGEVAPYSGSLSDRERTSWYLEVIDERDDLRVRYSAAVEELVQTKATLEAAQVSAEAARKLSAAESRKAAAGSIILAVCVGVAFGGGVAIGVRSAK